MAAFYWHWQTYTLESGHTIDDVYNALVNDSNGLTAVAGAKDVTSDGKTVHANVQKFRVAVLCLPMTAPAFWMIVAVSGDGTGAEANSVLNQVVGQIGILSTDSKVF